MNEDKRNVGAIEELRQRTELAARFQKVPFGYSPAQVAEYLMETRRTAEQQQNEIRREQDQLLLEIDQLHSEVAAKNIAIEALKRESLANRQEAIANRLLSEEATERVLEEQKRAAASGQRLAEAEAYIAKCEKAMEEAERLLAENESELDRLRAALFAMQAEQKQYETEHAYCEQVRRIMATLGEAAGRVRGVMAENRKLEAEITERDARIEALEEELRSLRQSPQKNGAAAEKRTGVRQAEARAMEKWEQADVSQDSFQTAYHQLTDLLGKPGGATKRETPYLFCTHA